MMKFLYAFLTHLFPSDAKSGQLGSMEQVAILSQCMGVPLLGIRRNETYWSRTVILAYCCVILLSTEVVYICFEIYHLIWNWPNLDAITHNVSLSFTHIAGFIKLANILWHLPSLHKTYEKLKSTVQRYVRTKEQFDAFKYGELENKLLLTIYAGMIGFTGLTGIVLLFLFPHGIAGERFPYCAKLPDIITTTIPLRLQLLYMGISVFMLALQIVAVDFLNIALMNQIRTQLNVLILSFKNININADISFSKEDHYTNRSPAFESLKSIIQHHCVLIELRNEVQRMYSMPVLLQFVTSLLVFGMTGFRATIVSDKENMAKDAIIYMYCGCIFLQLSFYCWFGNEVFETSKVLASKSFGTRWFECDQQFKTAFLIFLQNAQTPFIFSGADFVALLLPTFTSILSKSYTSIAVLRQIYGK